MEMSNTQSLYKSPAGERAIMDLYDSVLARWPVRHETCHLPTRHGDTFVIVSGEADASPLVLLHGAGSNSAIWAGDVVKYSRRHRVYAVDLLGEAGKSAPNRPAWDGPAYAEWLEDVLDGLHAERPVLIGVSQGSWTALKFATCRPERVSKLILLCPGGIVPDRLSFIVRAVVFSFMGRKGVVRMTHSLFGDQPVTPEAQRVTDLIMAHFKSRVGVLPIFTNEQLRRLTMPVLLLMGAQDSLRPTEKIVARMQALLPQISTVILPKAGHVLYNTARHILPFLASTEMQIGQDVGRYGAFVTLGTGGHSEGVDQLMGALAEYGDLPTLKLVDFALGLVNTPQGSERVRHYLFNGSTVQRNFAALYFKRRGNSRVLGTAVAEGAIDTTQAYAE
jgi:pimeloyl-ACP methyl ester carboxylesterase